MATKKTIAIIGAGEDMDPAIVKHLSTGNYRLLLFDKEKENIQKLVNQIKFQNKSADIEYTGCPFDASWEADMIFLNRIDANEITARIKPVATQKPVIDLSEKISFNELQNLLPDSKVIGISKADPNETINIIQTL